MTLLLLAAWAAAAEPRLVPQVGNLGEVVAMDTSADGRRLVSVDESFMLHVWDLETGSEIRTITTSLPRVHGVQLSADGETVFVVGHWREQEREAFGGNVAAWDVATGTLRWRKPYAFPRRISLVDRGGTLLVGWIERKGPGGVDFLDPMTGELREHCELQGWEDSLRGARDAPAWAVLVDDGVSLREGCREVALLRTDGRADDADDLAIRADGRAIAAALGDRGIVWDLDRDLRSEADLPTGAHGLEFVGADIVVLGRYSSPRLWDPELGGRAKWAFALDEEVSVAVGAADGSAVYFASGSSVVERPLPMERAAMDGRPTSTTGLALRSLFVARASGDGRWLAVSGHERASAVFDLETGRLAARLPSMSGGARDAMGFEPDGAHLLGAARGGRSLCRWRVADGAEIWCVPLEVVGVAVSPDGASFAVGSRNGALVVGRVSDGAVLGRVKGHRGRAVHVRWSPDGARIATAGEDGITRIWSAADLTSLGTFRSPAERADTVRFAPDGGSVWLGGARGLVRRDLTTGDVVDRAFAGTVRSFDLSPDGTRLVVGGAEGAIHLIDATSLEVVGTMPLEPFSVSFGPGGRVLAPTRGGVVHVFDGDGRPLGALRVGSEEAWVVTGGARADGWDGLVATERSPGLLRDLFRGDVARADGVWAVSADLERAWFSQELPRELRGRASVVSTLRMTETNRLVFSSGGASGRVDVWDLAAGRRLGAFPARAAPDSPEAIWVDPDGSAALAPSGAGSPQGDGAICDWSLEDLRLIGCVPSSDGVPEELFALARLPGGRLVSSVDEALRLHEGDGRIVRTWPALEAVDEIAVSSDGRRLAVGTHSRGTQLFDAETLERVARIAADRHWAEAVRFSPDGQLLVSGGNRGVRLWDAATGRKVGALDVSLPAQAFAFSPDGTILAEALDDAVNLWDVASREEIDRLAVVGTRGLAFDSAGRLWTAGLDGVIRAWSAGDRRELVRIVPFVDGTWAVIDPDGRYDASFGGDVDGLKWVIDGEVVALDQLKARYYEPGLLGKVLGVDPEPLREVGELGAVELFPVVDLEGPDGDGRVVIRATDRGGGIGPLVVRLNGKEVVADARPSGFEPGVEQLEVSLDVSRFPAWAAGRRNEVEVQAYDADQILSSRGLRATWTPPAAAESAPPELYAVVVGISDYLGGDLDLRFATEDAADFADALERAGAELFGPDRVHVARLTDVRPTKDVIAQAFASLGAARPEDVVVVYLAGHGVSEGDEYRYLTADARALDLTDPAVRDAVSISGGELVSWLTASPAAKQVLVLDTCAAGAIVGGIAARSVGADQVRALERMKDRAGLFVLAGASRDAVSYESSLFGQGLLTYGLLAGLRGDALRDGEFVDVQQLFAYASERVPQLARTIGGAQHPILAVPRGGASFDIGRVTDEVRREIELAEPRASVGPSVFQDEVTLLDPLGLARQVDTALARLASDDARAPWVVLRAVDDAWVVSGRYDAAGGGISLDLVLGRGGAVVARRAVEGATPDEVVARIVEVFAEVTASP